MPFYVAKQACSGVAIFRIAACPLMTFFRFAVRKA
jgi:hypothetical protein